MTDFWAPIVEVEARPQGPRLLECFCKGRGWTRIPGQEWPVQCPFCDGHGHMTVRQVAAVCGISIPTARRLLDGRPVRERTLYRVIDNLEEWAMVMYE